MNTTLKKKISSLPLLVATGVLVMSGCSYPGSEQDRKDDAESQQASDGGGEVAEDKTAQVIPGAEGPEILVGGENTFLRVIPGDSPELEAWFTGGGEDLLYMRLTCDGGHIALADGDIDREMNVDYKDGPTRTDEYTVTWLGPNPIGEGPTSPIEVSNLHEGSGGYRVLVTRDGGDDQQAFSANSSTLKVFGTQCREAGRTPANFVTGLSDDKE